MLKTNQRMPFVVAAPPRGGRDAEHFANGIRAYAERLGAAGVVFVSSHWNRASDPASIIVEVDNERPDEGLAFSGELPVPSLSAFALSERTAALLKQRGLTSENGRTWLRNEASWQAMLDAHVDAPFPLIHVSVPARYEKKLMRLVARALQPLREERILLVGISAASGDAIRRAADRNDQIPPPPHIDQVEGVPV